MRIAQFGTFDVNNFGDLLFPLITEHFLKKLDEELHLELYSPVGCKSSVKLQRIVYSIHEMANLSSTLNGFLIGGGDIISLEQGFTYEYQDYEKLRKISPHFTCWAMPALINKIGVPIAWNAVGIPKRFSENESILIRHICKKVGYLSVRDEISKENLLEAGVQQPIAVVPDTVLLLPEVYPLKDLHENIKHLSKKYSYPFENKIIFQLAPYFLHVASIEKITALLKKVSEEQQTKIILLPLGHCHDDVETLRKINKQLLNYTYLIEEDLSLKDTTSIIAHGKCFFGSSLHGAITAFAFQVPFLSLNLNKPLSKLDGFAHLIGMPERCLHDLVEWEEKKGLLNSMNNKEILEILQQKIHEHFRKIFSLFSQKSLQSSFEGTEMAIAYIQNLHHKAYLDQKNASLEFEKIHLENSNTCLKAQQSYLEKELKEIYSSRTWKLASFMRYFSKCFGLNKLLNK